MQRKYCWLWQKLCHPCSEQVREPQQQQQQQESQVPTTSSSSSAVNMSSLSCALNDVNNEDDDNSSNNNHNSFNSKNNSYNGSSIPITSTTTTTDSTTTTTPNALNDPSFVIPYINDNLLTSEHQQEASIRTIPRGRQSPLLKRSVRSFGHSDNVQCKDEECLSCTRFTKRQKKNCSVCKLPIHLLALITTFLTKYELFCVVSFTCKEFYNIVNSVAAWHNRLFLLKDCEFLDIGHSRFLRLVKSCQFRNLCLWQDQTFMETEDTVAIGPNFPHGVEEEAIEGENMSVKSLFTIFQNANYLNFTRCLQTLVLKTQYAMPRHIFLVLQNCINLESLRYLYCRGSEPSYVKVEAASEPFAVDAMEPLVQCRGLKHVALVIDSPDVCSLARTQLDIVTKLILKTQRLAKLDLSGACSFITSNTLIEADVRVFDCIEELILKGQDISSEALSLVLQHTRRLGALLCECIPNITSHSLVHLPESLQMLMLFQCKNIGVGSNQLTVPSLSNLNKLGFTSILDPDQVSLQRGETVLLWKLMTACDPNSLNEVIMNNHGKYCVDQVFSCNIVREKLKNVKTMCLANFNLKEMVFCNFIESNARTDLKVAIANDCSRTFPIIPKATVHLLTQKCKDLLLRSHCITPDWLEIFSSDCCVTKCLELVGCTIEGRTQILEDEDDEDDFTHPHPSCKSVEQLSLLSRCSFPLNYFRQVFATFSHVKSLKLVDLNPYPLWTLQILSQHCSLLESLTLKNCTHPCLCDDEDMEEYRLPMAQFPNLKEFNMCSCSNPSLKQLCLTLLSMPRVESFSLDLRMGTNLEIQYATCGAMQLTLVNHCTSGLMYEMEELIKEAIVKHLGECVSLLSFWEWRIFIQIFGKLFDGIFIENAERLAEEATPLIDPRCNLAMMITELKSCLNVDRGYMVLKEKPDRLKMLNKGCQAKFRHQIQMEEATRCGSVHTLAGLRTSIPVVFHHFMICAMRTIESL